MSGRYDFPNPFAQKVLEKSKTGVPTWENPGLRMSSERQSIWVVPEAAELFSTRNGAGQTLLYCLLRFTKNDFHRNMFLRRATEDQLVARNTACGSTALMGFFWGEFENPRIHQDEAQRPMEMAKRLTELRKKFPGVQQSEELDATHRPNFDEIASIPNWRNETCFTFMAP